MEPSTAFCPNMACPDNARGRFTRRLPITYHVKGAVLARLTLRTAGYVLTTTVRLTPAPLSCRTDMRSRRSRCTRLTPGSRPT